MQETSALYRQIVSDPNHWYEVSITIGEPGRLIDERSNVLLFGNTAILISSSAAEAGYGEAMIWGCQTYQQVFANTPTIGNAIAAEIDVKLTRPSWDIPRRAMIKPYVRATNGELTSEWIQKGVYFIDTREYTASKDNVNIMAIHGYDAMLMTEQDYPSDNESEYPKLDIRIVEHIAQSIGTSVDARTYGIMTLGYTFPLPVGYSSREVLCMIAAAYGGNFVMNDMGELRLVLLNELPPETGLLLDHAGYRLVFGGDRINIWQTA